MLIPALPPRRLMRLAALLWCSGLYGTGAWAGQAGLWLDAQGQLRAQAEEAVALLADAASHGLEPQDYAVDVLRQTLARARAGAGAPDAAAGAAAGAAAPLAATLDAAMQRYLTDLHEGRADLQALPQAFTPPQRAPWQAGVVLAKALAQGQLAEAVSAAAPALRQYQQLREALAHYRALAAHPAWQQAWPALPRPASGGAPQLAPGDAYAGLPMLAARLQALGDLPAQPSPAAQAAPHALPQRYAGQLVDALRRFQGRHGLVVDGVLGPATMAALQVTPAQRADQIALALERLRWTPLRQGPRMVVVNIPEFVLRAYELVDQQIQVRAEMKVIVGQALDTRTPLFDEDMRAIEFSPYWNVPSSIARAELLPRLQRDPGHFDREGFEFVAADNTVLTRLTAARLADLSAGRLRIRQRPGPRNALGAIKFVFPNQQAIFMHHTPALQLFDRARRDFSHGCIRVEQPLALARFVLQGQRDADAWPDTRIEALMAAGRSTTLRLHQPVPVLIAYGTALVKNGQVHFFNDLYGQDSALAAAMRQARPPLAAPAP